MRRERNVRGMTTTQIVIALAALLALAGVAAADPGCHPQPVPIKNDCGFDSAKEGASTHNASEAGRGEVCVSNAHHKQGPWVKVSLCLTGIVNTIAKKLHIDLHVDLYASQDGADLDSNDHVLGRDVDFEKTPLNKTDDMTWQALSTVHGKVDKKLPVDTRDAPVGGDSLPHEQIDACAHARVCG